jgi:hypothetical protein
MSTVITITAAAAGIDSRAPYSVLTSTSRPSASVPSQCDALGPDKRVPTVSLGPAHDHSGTVTATRTHSSSTPPPITIGHDRSAPRIAARVPASAGGTRWSMSSAL